MTKEEKLAKLNELFKYIREYQKYAEEWYGINDIFQDNGGKLLQVLLVTQLENMTESREGNDARDLEGNEYELKSVNIKLTKSFSTNHHINQHIIDKYRKVDWIFAVYQGIELLEIYQLTPAELECYYKAWENKLNKQIQEAKKRGDSQETIDKIHINNPKIPLKYVEDNGILLYENHEFSDFKFANNVISHL